MNSVDVRRWGASLRVPGTALLLTLAFGAAAVSEALAQQGPQPIRVEYDRSHPDDVLVTGTSPFQLRGQADLSYASNRGRGSQRIKFVPVGILEHYFIGGGPQWNFVGTPGGQVLFQGSLLMSAPNTEWAKHRVKPGMESLNNVAGGGYNHVRTITHVSLYQPERWLPADDLLGRVHSGVRTTTDGGCTDHSVYAVSSGVPAGATSDCEPTWGSEGFAGASRAIPFSNWVQFFNDATAPDKSDFHWDWWRVPEQYVTDELIGDYQTYGTIVDYGVERRARMGSVMPDGVGTPTEQGWPMGIAVNYDMFTFEFPALTNVTFWQATVVNESERVWGQPLDYDSLYMGMMQGYVLAGQNVAEYFRPDIGGVLFTGSGAVGCVNSLFPTGVVGCGQGFNSGGGAILVLNSPLGDLRNKNFSDPGSPFFAPDHPSAGDTITFNIGRQCGFGVACWNRTSDRSTRAGYGYIAGDLAALLDGQTEAELDASSTAAWWRIFRNHDYPTRTARWNQWAPAGWNYNRDATGKTQIRTSTQDTLTITTCLGEEWGGPPGGGCSELWSDTMPGRLNNAWNNIGGALAFGPFSLAAGDTTRFTLAFVSGRTPTGVEAAVAQALTAYRSSYLLPTAPPTPNIISVSTQPGDRGRNPGARVTFFLDDSPEEFVDQFLLLQADAIEGTQMDTDNPGLVAAIRERAVNNLAEMRVYKSCNAGRTFTSTGNCFGNPALDESGTPIGLGWQPLAVFEADENGRVPNIFTDAAVTAGQRYLYVFVSVSRGFEADVVDRDGAGNPIATRLEIAPSLSNPLSLSVADRNVVSVYVPASRQAGAQPAAADFVVDDPHAPIAYTPVAVTLTGDDVTAGRYQVVFADSIVLTETRTAENTIESFMAVYRTVMTSLDDGATLTRVVYDSASYHISGPDGVTIVGGTTTGSLDDVGDTQTTVYSSGLNMVVVTQGGNPLLVTNNLTGVGATPGLFFGRSDFPGFVLSVSTAGPGTFVAGQWVEPSADTVVVLRAGGSPTVRWGQTAASSTGRRFGEYHINFTAPEFGPTRLFRLNLLNPQETRTAFVQSVNARAVASQTQVTDAVVQAIRETGTAAGDASMTAAGLVQVDLPFTMTHANTGRPVILAMRAASKRDSITLGSTTQTLTVPVPEDKWVPGEQLIVLEQISRFQTASGPAGTFVVTDASGAPVTHDSLMVTWNAIQIACETPVTCNPLVPGTAGATTHLPVNPASGEFLRVRYRPAINLNTRYEFQVTPALSGEAVVAVTAFDLEEIKVVPNPYIVFSRYERDPQNRRLMFAGLPPRGTIEVYTVAGQFVQRITYDEQDLAGNGDLFWNMRTHENNDIASGLYLFVVDGTLPASGQRVRKTGKFVVIRGS